MFGAYSQIYKKDLKSTFCTFKVFFRKLKAQASKACANRFQTQAIFYDDVCYQLVYIFFS